MEQEGGLLVAPDHVRVGEKGGDRGHFLGDWRNWLGGGEELAGMWEEAVNGLM